MWTSTKTFLWREKKKIKKIRGPATSLISILWGCWITVKNSWQSINRCCYFLVWNNLVEKVTDWQHHSSKPHRALSKNYQLVCFYRNFCDQLFNYILAAARLVWKKLELRNWIKSPDISSRKEEHSIRLQQEIGNQERRLKKIGCVHCVIFQSLNTFQHRSG